jgi:peptidyl-prolyl cis-trans isomerase B (cyclophilin B)
MKKSLFLIFLSTLIIIMSSCERTDSLITIKTEFGDMVAILYDETPKHKENFIKLAKEHYFDSLMFHRVMQGFMIQGGDPDSKKAAPGQMLGQGGPGYTIPAEINEKFFHEKGALAAARLGDQQNPSKASSGSQFYIVQGAPISEDQMRLDPEKFNTMMMTFFGNPANKSYYDTLKSFIEAQDKPGYEKYLMEIKVKAEEQTGIKAEKDISPEKLKAYSSVGGTPALDGQYTVFGKVLKGLDVIDKITAQPVDRSNRPTKDIRMTVTVEDVPVSEIEKLYGYKVPEIKK